VVAQVDRRLTKVNIVDLLIRVNNSGWNLGRHSLPPLNRISSWDSITRLEQHFLTGQRLQGRKIYSLIFLNNENSYRAKDTWCSPRCLNVVHEGAGDGCVHGKLKEGKLRRRCRGTSLQVSNRGTRTSPRTEAWSTLELGFFSRSSSGLLLEVVDEDGETACLMSGRSNNGDGLVECWPKLAGEEKQERRHCRARKQARLSNGNNAEGFPFL
jgi:hypothetical protein